MGHDLNGGGTTAEHQYRYLNGSWQQSAAITRRGGDVVGTITQRDAKGFVVGSRQPKVTGSAAQAPDGSLAAVLTNQATQPTSNDARYDRTFVNDSSGTTVFVSQGGYNNIGEVKCSIATPASGYQGAVTQSGLTSTGCPKACAGFFARGVEYGCPALGAVGWFPSRVP